MTTHILLLLLAFIVAVHSDLTSSPCLSQVPFDPCCPTQVHIALGDAYYNAMNPDNGFSTSNATMFVTWQTQTPCDNTYVYVNATNLNFVLNTSSQAVWPDMINTTYNASNNGIAGQVSNTSGQYLSYSHTASLNNLQAGANYSYQILQTNGSNYAGPYTFKVPDPSTDNNQLKLAIFADIDTAFTNATLIALSNIAETNPSAFDMQLFLGDLGYNIYSENGTRGEYFYNAGQSFLATWPFMVTPGNHELFQNYSFLSFRTKMPLYNQTQNHYYSFNIGKAHFISIEYYFAQDNTEYAQAMLDWLESDLKQADADRDVRPWIIVYSHQPIYCSYDNPIDPPNKRCYAFYGLNEVYDQLYYNYTVDLVLQGHVHYWERMGPTYQNQSQPYGSWGETPDNHNFLNPQAPIYTIEGSGGNDYFMVEDPTPLMSYSINCDTDIAYSTLTMVNESALYYEHVNSADGTVIDNFYLIKGSQYPGYVAPPTPTPTPTPSPSGGSKMWIIVVLLIVMVVAVGFYITKLRQRKVMDLEQGMVDNNSELSLQNIY